ncbi:beta-1,4-galactosyltransferase 3-like isoform 3-T7 [Liasis olivaceus]
MKKMNLSRAENPCFLLLLVTFQVIFVLILYRVGLLTITFDTLHSERTIIRKNPYVQSGGCYSPPHCLARYKTAIIVPYRNCEKQLHHFLYYLHPFLQRQQLSYCIYLIHQAGSGPFNRAKLLNVGVHEALKDNDWNCLLLHNMDLVPENDYNLYVCDEYYPKHLSTAIDKLYYRLPYSSFFGGVTALTPDHYMKINGFPNTYWERLGEDDDIAERSILLFAFYNLTFTANHLDSQLMASSVSKSTHILTSLPLQMFHIHFSINTLNNQRDIAHRSLTFCSMLSHTLASHLYSHMLYLHYTPLLPHLASKLPLMKNFS